MGDWDSHEYAVAMGFRMHAAVTGPASAPPVVCVHGLGCSHRYFGRLAQLLAPEFQTVAVDLPGFGWSPGPATALGVRGTSAALAQWLRATGRAGAILVGDSTGCQVIIDLALTDPDLPGPVVLGGPTFDRHARTVSRQAARMVRNLWADHAGWGIVPIRWRDRRDSGLRRWVQTFRRCLPDPVEAKIGWVDTPAVVVRGARDPIVPARWAEELTGLLPGARLVTVPDAGHTVNYVRPVALASIIRSLAHRATPQSAPI